MKAPESGETWGILGGTFDPIHKGHLSLASDIKNIKKLDGILIVPSFLHPFKKEHLSASYEDRLAMTRLAAASLDVFVVSTIERDLNLPGYTLDTIKAIKNAYSDITFYFIIGADNIAQLPLWHNISEILKEIKIIVGKRPHFELNKIENDFSDSLEYIKTSEVDISSTEIKKYFYKKNLKNSKQFYTRMC